MNKEWMKKSRLSQEYSDGVDEFIQFALDHGIDPNKIRCPCVKCGHVKWISVDLVKDHLITKGISQGYTHWKWHGEETRDSTTHPDGIEEFHADNASEADRIADMIHDLSTNLQDHPHIVENLTDDANMPLYPDCTKFTRLSALLKLYNLKTTHGWTDKSFTALLELLKDMLPEDNCLPQRTYEAKKILRSMGMNYEKIHACPNDCILYRKEYSVLDKCPIPRCEAPRYKKNGAPSKVLWYFPVIPRFRRLFANPEDAKKLTWHADGRKKDRFLRHPADSPQWTMIDTIHQEFGKEDRNLRLALSTDGMNPHGSLSSNHSTWPVVLVIYNLPPGLCMKHRYMMLSLLISGPKQPGNDIDVYLAPLIEDLKVMWQDGVEVYDAYRKENFHLRAMLFCTINDFPAYGNLSGYSVKGHYACPICLKKTCYQQLKHSSKTVYLGHRRYLPGNHRYRKLRKAFNGEVEEETAPLPLSGQQIFNLVKDINVTYGKTGRVESRDGWKKRSIFFELPYWKDLFVRHCLDVMHIEKNICDGLIGTLLNIPGKSKDGIKARMDYKEMNIRGELHPVTDGRRTYLPPACYTLSKKEKEEFCNFLHDVKVPAGYSSNIRSLVSLKDLKLIGLKSHDCHILLQQMLPVAIRSILPKHVRFAITRFCFFFKKLCSKVIDPRDLPDLQTGIAVSLCEIEMYFPPGFCVIMVHLTVHLVREVQLCGPVCLRWMYPFERYMKILKCYVKNPNRPEGCIVERYIMEEAIEFCSDYLPTVEAIGLPKRHHMTEVEWRGISGLDTLNPEQVICSQAHLYVLNNDDEFLPYIEDHMNYVKNQNPRNAGDERWITKEHNRTFPTWLRELILQKLEDGESVSERLQWISQGPKGQVITYTSMEVKSCTFYTKDQDDKSATQNSGVTLVAEAMHVASAKDKNPVYESMSYYGLIEQIWVLIYTDEIQIPLFYCKWVDNNSGVRNDEMGFTLVDLNKVSYTDDPFILATQAKQIFYVRDPIDRRWSVVMSTPSRNLYEYNEDMCEESSNIISVIPGVEDENVDIYLRDDHGEGIWLNEEIEAQGGSSSTSNKKRKTNQI